MYALRRIKDAFKENKGLQDNNEVKQNIEYGFKSLGIIQRQVKYLFHYKFVDNQFRN